MAKKTTKPVKKIAKKEVKKKVVAKKVEVKKPAKKKEVTKKPSPKSTPKKIVAKSVNKPSQKQPTPKKPEKKIEQQVVKKEIKIQKEAPKKEPVKNIVIGKKDTKISSFKAGDHAFYPSHGVGKILEIQNAEIGGQKINILIMYFEKERLTIKIPSSQIVKTGLRHLISKKEMEAVFNILKSGVKKTKGMWSRRAQEYEEKINSGNIILLAEVLRDLTRDIEDGDRSYSERIIYETAINRLALEYSVIEGVSFEEAKEKIISVAKHKLGNSADAKPIKNLDDDFDAEDAEESDDEEEDDDDFDYDFSDDDDDEEGGSKKKRGRKKKK